MYKEQSTVYGVQSFPPFSPIQVRLVGDIDAVTIFTVEVAGAITPSGALTKVAQIGVGGAISPSGVITKIAQKLGLAGSIGPTGSLTKIANKETAGSITPSATLGTQLLMFQSMSGVIGPIGVLGKLVLKNVSGIISMVGTLATSGGSPIVAEFIYWLRRRRRKLR